MKPLEEMGKFATVVVDPPWPIKFGNGKTKAELFDERRVLKAGGKISHLGTQANIAALEYPTMTVKEIGELSIGEVLDEDSLLFVWTTQSMLPHTFNLIQQWGTRYCYTMTWHKPWGVKPFDRPMYNSEFIIVGLKGSPQYTTEKMFLTCNTWPNPRQNSVKPEGFYDLLRRVTPGPWLDVFGRRRIAGFESWGDEAPEGPALPDHYQTVFA